MTVMHGFATGSLGAEMTSEQRRKQPFLLVLLHQSVRLCSPRRLPEVFPCERQMKDKVPGDRVPALLRDERLYCRLYARPLWCYISIVPAQGTASAGGDDVSFSPCHDV